MRLIDYYNYIATAAYIIIVVAALCFSIWRKKRQEPLLGNWGNAVFFILILVLASFLRIYKLGEIPYGLQQDEASIGYDAYTLATYGIDRNGYHWPIYPITWGCGGGSPLLIYMNVVTTALFGTGVFKLRLIPAICGILTVALFYFTLRLCFIGSSHQNEKSLTGAFFLAVCPWHVILSRWSLDCNIMPFNMMLAAYLFMLAVHKKNTFVYCLSAAAFAVCMYSYGAATIVVPVFLVLICLYCLHLKVLTGKQLVLSMVTFMVVFMPLFVFYAVNYLGVPEIITENFSFNKFTAPRTGEAFITFDGNLAGKLLENLKIMVRTVTTGDDNHTLAHFYPGYATLFEFTFPITLLGIILSLIQLFMNKRNAVANGVDSLVGNGIFLFMTIASVILELVIQPDISRMVMMFIPFIYFFVKGTAFVVEQSRVLFVAIAGILMVGALSFSRDYFTDFNRWSIAVFMPGYGEAIQRAYEIAGDGRMIYSTYEGLSSPFMLALYYNEYDPYKFYTTVEYKDPDAEFRIARSFGNFVFELPGGEKDRALSGDVFVVSTGEAGLFDHTDELNIEEYGGYLVVYK